MYVLYGLRLCILIILISMSRSLIIERFWMKVPYSTPVNMNVYSWIRETTVFNCIAICIARHNWDQIYVEDRYCYCLAPVYETVYGSGLMTNTAFWSPRQDATSCTAAGYTLFPDEGYCLKYFTTKLTWLNADSRCRQDGGHLMSVYNMDDHTNFRSLYPHNTSLYLGAHRTYDGFNWINGGSVAEGFWKNDEPNNFEGNEDCVQVASAGAFNDKPCDALSGFICQILLKEEK